MISVSVYLRKRERKTGYVYEIISDYTVNGKRIRKSKVLPQGTKKTEAERIANKMQLDIEFGDYIDKEPISLAEYFDSKYMVNYVSIKQLSPTTIKGYKQMFNVEGGIREMLGNEYINNITTEKIQTYVGEQINKYSRSSKTIKNQVGLISNIIERAMIDGYVTRRENPVRFVVLPKWEKKQTEAYSLDEVREMMRRAEKKGDLNMLTIIALCCLAGGLRRSELCGLKMSKCFVEDEYNMKYIEISESVVQVEGGQEQRNCKSASSIRKVPIGDTLAGIILKVKRNNLKKKLMAGQEFEGGDYLLIMDKFPYAPLKPNYIYNSFKKFLRRECPDMPELRLHDLRATFASLCAELEWKCNNLKSAIGHADISTTQRFYIKSFEESLVEDVEKLEMALTRSS